MSFASRIAPSSTTPRTKVVKGLYNVLLRPHLPHKLSVYNGVVVPNVVRLFDVAYEFPRYKGENVFGIRRYVERGDGVVVVGAGLGVTTVWAAREAGPSGTVTALDADGERVQLARKTAQLNGVDDSCEIRHAVVGSDLGATERADGPDLVGPSEIPDCDVLEIDCEGAELSILRDLRIRPKAIVVESHPQFGSPTRDVKRELDRLDYEVEFEFPDPVDGEILLATSRT